MILDRAAQKGTGKWTSQNALDLGAPLPLITEAVFARVLSSLKDQRVAASKVLSGPAPKFDGDRDAFIESVRRALYLQQDHFVRARASRNCARHRKSTSGTCITARSRRSSAPAASSARASCRRSPMPTRRTRQLANLLLDPYFSDIAAKYQDALRDVVVAAVKAGMPVPAFSSAVAYFDSYRSERLPANLVQAQRDFFGAHTFERIDKPGSFHANWS